MLKLLEEWLHHKNDMVNIEAAKIILQLKDITEVEATSAISGLYF